MRLRIPGGRSSQTGPPGGRQLRESVGSIKTVGDPGSVSAIIGSGRMRLNPALVTVSVIETPEGAEVRIRGVAKEGLIKQRGGEQVAAEVADAIAGAVAT